MYKEHKVIVIIPCFNEGKKIGNIIKKQPMHLVDKVLIIDDGSTDNTARVAVSMEVEVISLQKTHGSGYAIREGLNYALKNNYDITVLMAGNDKDNPQEITRILNPICDDDYDFVQGSRYLKGGYYGGDFPLYRKIATRIHAFLFSLATGKHLTDSTNGFRAFRTKIIEDPRINLNQQWLNQYELEPYLYYNIIQLGYRTKEVPVSKIYPPKEIGYTKMKPIISWWSILRPIVYLRLGIKK